MTTEQFDWKVFIETMIETIQQHESAPAIVLAVKLSEEVGELSEAVLSESGYLKHKTKTLEGIMGETADIFNVLIGILSTQYPNKTASEITAELQEAMQRKWEKYERILNPE